MKPRHHKVTTVVSSAFMKVAWRWWFAPVWGGLAAVSVVVIQLTMAGTTDLQILLSDRAAPIVAGLIGDQFTLYFGGLITHPGRFIFLLAIIVASLSLTYGIYQLIHHKSVTGRWIGEMLLAYVLLAIGYGYAQQNGAFIDSILGGSVFGAAGFEVVAGYLIGAIALVLSGVALYRLSFHIVTPDEVASRRKKSVTFWVVFCLVGVLVVVAVFEQSIKSGGSGSSSPWSLSTTKGDPDAPHKLIVYTDGQCQGCRAIARAINGSSFQKNYINTDAVYVELRLVWQPRAHTNSQLTASQLYCATKNGTFWDAWQSSAYGKQLAPCHGEMDSQARRAIAKNTARAQQSYGKRRLPYIQADSFTSTGFQGGNAALERLLHAAQIAQLVEQQ